MAMGGIRKEQDPPTGGAPFSASFLYEAMACRDHGAD